MSKSPAAVPVPPVAPVPAPRSPSVSLTHQEHLIRPQHTNALGTVFGGEVMSWVDSAAAACAMRHCGTAVVTASIDALHFVAPVPMGWVVCLDAAVNYTARTSCEIGVRVTAFHPVSGELRHTATAYLTFVGLDPQGKPTPIPPLKPETPKERERYAAAELRRRGRLELKERLQKSVTT